MVKARSKKRSQPGGANGMVSGKPGTSNRLNVPQSMVIRMGAGDIGTSVSQLAADFREVVQPHTAARLKERKSNKLRDYTTMAGPLGVTHFFLFSRSENGNVHLRFALHPRGPTLQFRVDDYVLAKDIQHVQKRSRAGWQEAFASPPLLVQHDKPKEKQLESLTQIMFNAMFPVITPATTKLEKIKRILLLKRERQEDGTFIMNLRHYAITQRRTGMSKRIKRLDPQEQRRRERKGAALPNLGQLEDAADYVLNPEDGGYTSASDTELDTDNEIEVVQTSTRKVLSKKEMEKLRSGDSKDPPAKVRSNVEKRAIKLVELGPRMKLRLVKVEEGMSEGRVMWNEFVTKSKVEEKELDQKWNEKRKLKEERRQKQKENVEKKKKLKGETKSNTVGNGEVQESDEESLDTDEVEDMLDDEMHDDDQAEDLDGVDEDEDEMEE
ncbi:rRNA-binding ribosome biosynthesis protein [Exophiala xenobiotica]|uniref:rRNA-binding ribosome biosynthesis protein n=1 Tax=Lithohypha guttulata TaxID=1690604 RepID=A0ABR0KKU8_9EURO|nr:rRNA-binding ribosome biosynthesis protein [Lithohypha guttulata]KAK5320922.1 rRNA-binding ribosome biosynthesis protein [Exophiala xenobiotica]